MDKVMYVSTSGSDETGDGSEERPFSTIERASKSLNGPGTLVLREGRFDFVSNLPHDPEARFVPVTAFHDNRLDCAKFSTE